MNKLSKGTYKFQIPSRFEIITFRMTVEVMNLLSGATENKRGDKVSNTILFYDLLSRKAVNAKVSNDFRRPLALKPGQAQYSEIRLAEQWQMNRTRLRNVLDRMEQAGLIYTDRSLVRSVITFPSVLGWSRPDKTYIHNTVFFHVY